MGEGKYMFIYAEDVKKKAEAVAREMTEKGESLGEVGLLWVGFRKPVDI